MITWESLIERYSNIMLSHTGGSEEGDAIDCLQNDFENAVYNNRIGWAAQALKEYEQKK